MRIIYETYEISEVENWMHHALHIAEKHKVSSPWVVTSEKLHPCGDVWKYYQIYCKPDFFEVLLSPLNY